MEKPEKMIKRFEELTNLISDPNVIANQEEWQKYVKEHASLKDVVETYEQFEKAEKEIADCKAMLESEKDSEMIAMLESEIAENEKKKEKLDEEYKILLLPKDENDDSNVIMEIRGGAGGEESSLFAGVLMRMYTMYAEKQGWRVQVLNLSQTELGGVKEAELFITGKGAFKRLKFESGVHRVQRVPETESQGRVHTSTATVAVLPEVKNVEIEINEKDIRIDTYCSGGAGGQHVNKTESACRITHNPTGIVVTCQDERSLIQNKAKAFEILKSKLYDFYQGQANSEYANTRKMQVGTGDRSERIRTYNYPQGRISDHRIGLTLYNLEDFVNGDLDEMIDALHMENTKKLLEQNA